MNRADEESLRIARAEWRKGKAPFFTYHRLGIQYVFRERKDANVIDHIHIWGKEMPVYCQPQDEAEYWKLKEKYGPKPIPVEQLRAETPVANVIPFPERNESRQEGLGF